MHRRINQVVTAILLFAVVAVTSSAPSLKAEAARELLARRQARDQRATYIASGILGPITGQGAHWLIVDDPIKNKEDAYSKPIRDRIDDNYRTSAATRMQSGGKKILVMTRWHEDDLAGRLLKRAQQDKKADQWVVIVLAAINDDGTESYIWNTRTGEKTYFPKYEALWPEAYSREWLEKEKANLGTVYWNAMYMQRPTSPGGEIFKRENWGYYDAIPQLEGLVQIYDGACEEGQENDYSASETMGSTGTTFPILDQWRDKVTFPYLMAKVYERWEMCAKLYHRYLTVPSSWCEVIQLARIANPCMVSTRPAFNSRCQFQSLLLWPTYKGTCPVSRLMLVGIQPAAPSFDGGIGRMA